MHFNYYIGKIWFLHIAALICLVLAPIEWFLAAVVIYWFAMPMFQLIFHDWVCHEYCKPRNQFIEFVLLLFFYLHDNNIRNKKTYHVWHHRQWATPENDPTYRKLEGVSLFKYFLGLQRNLDLKIPDLKIELVENRRLFKWMDLHSRSIYISWIVFALVVFPWSWIVATIIFYPWLLHLALCYHDWHLHGPKQRLDHNWLVIIFGHATWHHMHHEHWREEYYGPQGFWRWINPAWYYRHLLFTKCHRDLTKIKTDN